MALQLLLIPQQPLDPPADGATILLELGFSRSSGADAAPLTGEAAPPAEQSRQAVTQLGQFHLQSTGGTAGALGKDVQDQFTAVGDRAGEQPFQVPGLDRGQFPIGDHQGGPTAAHLQGGFLQFSCAPKGLRIGAAGPLTDHRHRSCTSTAHQTLQFRQFPLSPCTVAVREGEEQHRFLGGVQGGNRWFTAFELAGRDVLLAEVAQIALLQLPPSLLGLTIGLQQFSLAQAVGARPGGKAQPAAGRQVEGDDSISAG